MVQIARSTDEEQELTGVVVAHAARSLHGFGVEELRGVDFSRLRELHGQLRRRVDSDLRAARRPVSAPEAPDHLHREDAANALVARIADRLALEGLQRTVIYIIMYMTNT